MRADDRRQLRPYRFLVLRDRNAGSVSRVKCAEYALVGIKLAQQVRRRLAYDAHARRQRAVQISAHDDEFGK